MINLNNLLSSVIAASLFTLKIIGVSLLVLVCHFVTLSLFLDCKNFYFQGLVVGSHSEYKDIRKITLTHTVTLIKHKGEHFNIKMDFFIAKFYYN